MSFPLSTAFSNQAALALAERGCLEEYWTCLNWRPGSFLDRVLPGALTRQLRRRVLPAGVDPARVRTSPWREAGRLLSARVPALDRRLARHETGPFSVDGVYRALDARVARRLPEIAPRARAVYAYEDGARDTFAAARSLGLKCLYDLPIGYWRAGQEIYAEEAVREPAWAGTLTGRDDSPAKLARKDAELAAADAVFTASTFTRRTLALAPGVRCPVHVVPYAAPPVPPVPAVPSPPAGKLRVLFAGSLGQRKGLSYLLAAAARLAGHVELTLLGAKTVAGCPALDAATRAHRWIPSLPHAEVLAEMERHDVLVFPSLFEGFGLVILEAMSRGLPVIATAHTAAPDLYTDGTEGFIVPIRSGDAIAEKLERLIREPALLRAMKEAARARAQTHRWDAYRAGLAAGIRRTLGDPMPC